ncbi:LemA family protein [Propioniciclava coleopterorum]|uniref:LemA family protein n=1 Tax=Propioniciclava coleopterorum TaxID=2714937 RepID=A0A6G7Y7A3_9ACTN|nr:LemA family protein [Propioniciclava coleopterorum]QIK72695.1 LemA family protein [Propioniciclava coleopterorum]
MEFLLILILVVVVAGGAWAFAAYNGFIRERNLIQESWRQVDVELNRRYELIPNLVETVRAYAAHERNTLEGIVRLRSQAQQLAAAEGGAAPSAARSQAEEQLSTAVRGLMVSVEAYPELRSNQNFIELQRQLAETEDRIAAGRRYYNANVRNYNTRIESVPTNVIANMFKFEKATYFEVNEPEVRRAPDVNFGEISYRGDTPQQQGQVGAQHGNELPNPQNDPSRYGQQAPNLGQPAPQEQYQAPNYGQQPPQQQGYQAPNYGQQPPQQQGYQAPNYGQQPPQQQGYQAPNYGQQPPQQGYQAPDQGQQSPQQQGYQTPNYGAPSDQPQGGTPEGGDTPTDPRPEGGPQR